MLPAIWTWRSAVAGYRLAACLFAATAHNAEVPVSHVQ